MNPSIIIFHFKVNNPANQCKIPKYCYYNYDNLNVAKILFIHLSQIITIINRIASATNTA